MSSLSRLIPIVFLLGLMSCQKPLVIKSEVLCLQTTPDIKPRAIRVLEADTELYTGYIQLLRDTITFHNNQVRENNSHGNCK